MLRFFLNADSKSYLRGLEAEFDESTNAIRLELNRFEAAGLLKGNLEGNRKVFRANPDHPLYHDIFRIMRKHTGIDRITDNLVEKLGTVKKAYIVGNLAMGLDTDMIELVLVGTCLDFEYLEELRLKAERMIKRSIHCVVIRNNDAKSYLADYPAVLLIWQGDGKK